MIISKRTKFLLKRISSLENQCDLKDVTIKHLIKENELLATQIVIAQSSKLTTTELQRFKNICKLDFPNSKKGCEDKFI